MKAHSRFHSFAPLTRKYAVNGNQLAIQDRGPESVARANAKHNTQLQILGRSGPTLIKSRRLPFIVQRIGKYAEH